MALKLIPHIFFLLRESTKNQPNMNEELKLQADCTTWFQNNMSRHRKKWRRVKNETDLKGKQGMIMGQLNKATGIVAGTWDSFFIVEPVVWLEFKGAKGVLSKEQIEFQEMGYEVGWKFVTVKTLEQFKDVCKSLFN
jgi:hypothetical protein